MLSAHIFPCMLVFAILAFGSLTSLASQSEIASSDVSIEGYITDSKGEAVFNTEVILVAHGSSISSDSIFPNGLVLARTKSDAEGKYKISTRKTDPRFVGKHCSVYVRALGFEHMLETFAPSRLLVDCPMDFRLTKASPFILHVLDENSKPIEGIRIAPATIGEKRIPFNVANEFSEVSDRNGNVTIHTAISSSLQTIYATSKSPNDPCHQCIEVKYREATATAKLLPIVRARGRLVFESNAPIVPFPKEPIRLSFVSKSTSDQSGRPKVFSWSDVELDANGRFEFAYWTDGQIDLQGSLPVDFPYVIDREQKLESIPSSSGEVILKLLPATLVRGKLVDTDTDQGVEGVLVDYFDRFSRPAVSNRDGSFEFWQGGNDANMYPMDPFGESISVGDGFYLSPESLPINGKIEMKPFKMRSMSKTKGRVIDERGNPIPGICIHCQTKLGRFDNTTTLLSDRNGNFQFFGVADGTQVTLTARSGTRGTKSPLRINLTNDVNVDLIISDLPSAQFVGRVIDHRNQPVAGAAVSIKSAITSSPETIRGLDRQVDTDEADSLDSLTDADGNFQSVITTLLSDERTVRVNAPGYLMFHSGWHRPNISTSKEGGSRIEVGTIQLTPEPEQKMVTIRIVDRETSMPILGAAIATLGARCGHMRQSLGNTSQREFSWVDTPKVLAVRADGYIPSIEAIRSIEDSMVTVQLSKEPKNIPTRFPTSDMLEQRIRASEELLSLVPVPSDKDTIFKKVNYYQILGFARPEKLVDQFVSAKHAGMLEIEMQAYMQELVQLNPKDPKRLLQEIRGMGKAIYLLQLAENVNDEAEQYYYLADAAVEMRQIQGDENLYLASKLACTMLKLGMVESAENLLRATWDNHKELRNIVKSNQRLEGRHNKQGVSRYFAPELAIVAPETAMKLIELTAYAKEIGSLQAEAICFMANHGTSGWDTQVERLKTLPSSDWGVMQFIKKVGFRNYERARAVADAMPPSITKIKLLMHIVEKCDCPNEMRLVLCREILDIIRMSKHATPYESLGRLAGQFSKFVEPLDNKLAEEFLFESIWQDGLNIRLPFGHSCGIATELAQVDAELARALVEPCFKDWSWLFGDLDNEDAYSNAPPLSAMASIDCVQTVAKVKELFSGELADQPSRKLSIVRGIVGQWRELRQVR